MKVKHVVISQAWLRQEVIKLSGHCKKLKRELKELEDKAVVDDEALEMVTYGDPKAKARKSDEYRAKAEQMRIAGAVTSFIKRLLKKRAR